MVERFKSKIEEIDYQGIYIADPVRNVYPEYDEYGRMRLSVSRMQLFEKCPLAFKFGYIDRLDLMRDTEKELLDNGKNIHDSLYKAAFQRNVDILRTCHDYNEYGVHYESFISFEKKLRESGVEMLYAEKEIFDEQDFIIMYVDRINMLEDGTVEILDYKTGAVHSMARHHFQLAVYAYYVEKHLALKVSRWSIFYTKHNKYKSEPVDRAKIRMIPEMIRLVRDRIDEAFSIGAFNKRPSNMCGFCPMLHYGLCSSGENKSYNSFGMLEIYSKNWDTKGDVGDRYLCGGIRVV